MSFRIFQTLTMAGFWLSASSIFAMQVDLSAPNKANAVLEQTLKICGENLVILDRLISDKKGTSTYKDSNTRIADTQKLEENAIKLKHIASEIEACDKKLWTSELHGLNFDFNKSMELQNELISLLQ